MKSIEAAIVRQWSRQSKRDRALSKGILSLDLTESVDHTPGKLVKGGGARLAALKREELKTHLSRIQGPGTK